MSEESDTEKEHEPTQQRLEQARRKGQIVRSTEISVAASYGAIYLVLAALGAITLTALGSNLMRLIAEADRIGPQMLGGGTSWLAAMLGAVLLAVSPWLIAPMLAVLAGLWAQRAFIFVPDKLMPKLNRIDPLAAAKQKFGRAGLFEFGKSTAKMIIVGLLLWRLLSGRVDALRLAQEVTVEQSLLLMGSLLREFLATVLLITVVFAAVDYLWQWFDHRRRNRMSRQELIDEMKDAEGDPHTKAQRQQRAREIATNRMLADVPRADVVVVNPTHYAVALAWQRGSGKAPVCVAKGVDAMAARIREIASESGVPIRSDPPTARTIYATVEIGAEIRRDHYRAVAAAIRYAETIRRRARARARA